MGDARILSFYLDDGLRQSAMARKHNFINRTSDVAIRAGFQVAYLENTARARAASARHPGYAMFHMDDPLHDRALTMRRVYHYPFWAIERSAQRWNWRVAQSVFPAGEVQRKQADRFYSFWQTRLFPDRGEVTRDGFVYVPLQGRLTDCRSFQSCAPLQMLQLALKHDPSRRVVAALHPKETYSAQELQALDALVQANPRLELQTGNMVRLLAACDYVVTQNSAAAFSGYFFGKPAVLFGQIDFHHIAANVADLGAAEAMAQAPQMAPDYAGYIHWFWQKMSINAGRPEAETQIVQALRRGGWPIE